MTSGIYIIEHTQSGKVYIGSSVNIEKRWRRHYRALRKGNHENRHLQRAWNKYGEEAFKFDVLKRCSPGRLRSCEQKAIDDFIKEQSWENLYNICEDVEASPMQGRKHSPETKMKLRASFTPKRRAGISVARKGKKASSEAKAKMSASMTPERRAKIGASHKGKKLTEKHKAKIKASWTPETRAKMSAARKGKKASPETKAKMSATRKGKKASPETRAKLMGNTHLLGYKFSPESKAKMSRSAIRGWEKRRKDDNKTRSITTNR